MASSTKLTVVDRSLISPPPCSVPATSLPLTFFDIPWLLFPPSQPLFFYHLPTTTPIFITTTLPKLKHTLSLTLQQFFPLAGKLTIPTSISTAAHLEYAENDGVLLTVATANATDAFKNLHCLVPPLPAADGSKQPLLSVQITVFEEYGICLGFTWRNVVADWRTFNNFLSAWASLYRGDAKLEDVGHVAFNDRSVIFDPSGIGSTFFKEWWVIKNSGNGVKEGCNESTYDIIRATFQLGPKEMEQIKKWILTRSELLFGSTQLLLSPYVIVCAFIWVCWMKAHWSRNEVYGGQNVVHYFGFIAGGMTRLRYTVPKNYVGNCVGFGRSSATRRELIGENGVVYAAKAIGDTIKKLNGDMMIGAQNWISEWETIRESNLHVIVTGSPKVGLYELDFGWGKPVKFEEVSIDTRNAISLNDSREVIGGIEIGVALPKPKMEAFTTLFNKGLNHYLFVNDS